MNVETARLELREQRKEGSASSSFLYYAFSLASSELKSSIIDTDNTGNLSESLAFSKGCVGWPDSPEALTKRSRLFQGRELACVLLHCHVPWEDGRMLWRHLVVVTRSITEIYSDERSFVNL